MSINNVHERIKNNYSTEELENFSKFFLVKYSRNENDIAILEVLPLSNDIDPFELEDDIFITDKNGNILLKKEDENVLTIIQSINNDKILLIERTIEHNNEGKYYRSQKVLLYEYGDNKLNQIEVYSNYQNEKRAAVKKFKK